MKSLRQPRKVKNLFYPRCTILYHGCKWWTGYGVLFHQGGRFGIQINAATHANFSFLDASGVSLQKMGVQIAVSIYKNQFIIVGPPNGFV
jgi:hypothetical protein